MFDQLTVVCLESICDQIPVQFVELIDTVIIFTGSEPVEPLLLFNLCFQLFVSFLCLRQQWAAEASCF